MSTFNIENFDFSDYAAYRVAPLCLYGRDGTATTISRSHKLISLHKRSSLGDIVLTEHFTVSNEELVIVGLHLPELSLL